MGFHRVIRGFMIQGGGFEPGLNQKGSGTPIENEAFNGLKNSIGAIAMARTGDPHSATAQFFINTVNNANLDHSSRPDWISNARIHSGWTVGQSAAA